MGLSDKQLLLRDGSVNLTGTEPGLPATAGTFVIDTATGNPVPSTGVVFETARVGPGTSFLQQMVAALICPALPTTSPSITVKLQTSDGYDASAVFQPTLATAVWEDVVFFSSEQTAGGLTSAPQPAAGAITTGPAVYRVGFANLTRRFIRANVSAFAGANWLGVIIRLEKDR